MRTTKQSKPHFDQISDRYHIAFYEGNSIRCKTFSTYDLADKFLDGVRAEMNQAEELDALQLIDEAKPDEESKPCNNPNFSNFTVVAEVEHPNPAFVQATDKIVTSIANVLKEKNKRYGNSALQSLNVFGSKSKVGQRADDKLARIKNSDELRKNDICDLIGYLFLICHENDWTDFADQID